MNLYMTVPAMRDTWFVYVYSLTYVFVRPMHVLKIVTVNFCEH